MRGKNGLKTEKMLEIIHANPYEMGNKELMEFFDYSSPTTIAKIKEEVRKIMAAHNPPLQVVNKNKVSTQAVMEYAGIDLAILEENYRKGQDLKNSKI